MRVTVSDVKGYVEAILADYPDAPEGMLARLVEELNAVQQLYFDRFHHETAVYEAEYPSSDLTITVVSEAGMAKVEKEDVLAVFFQGVEHPYMSPEEFFATGRRAYTYYDNAIVLRAPQSTEDLSVTVIYRKRPADLTCSEGTVSGAIYVPAKHLPLLSNKLRECAARSVFENKESDCYALAYNNWLTVLDGYENGDGSPLARARAAL